MKAAKACNYLNAGTVEFLFDRYGHFYFLEVNTRIQVEHPITEIVTGVDIVKEQIKIASGQKLSRKQDDIRFKGVAIECRINAEDPAKDFMPNPGKIDMYLPAGGNGVRIDSHAYPGYKISPYYDSMIAKLISYGKNRHEAILTMKRALDEFVIEPIKTTLPFHKHVMEDMLFVRGDFATDYVENMTGIE